MRKKPTQKDRILGYLRSGRKLSRLNSWDQLGVIETPARISELRRDGWDIVTQMVTVENRFGEDVRIAIWTLEI